MNNKNNKDETRKNTALSSANKHESNKKKKYNSPAIKEDEGLKANVLGTSPCDLDAIACPGNPT